MNAKRQAKLKETRQTLLRGALQTNALFSGLTGLLMVLVPGRLSETLGLGPAWLVGLVGGGLLAFSADLFYQSSRGRLITWRVLLASTGDCLWVLGSLVLLALAPESLTGFGYWAVGGVAIVVALMGTLQLLGIHRIHFDPVRKVHRHCVRIKMDAAVEDMWPKIGDLGSIQKYYPTLTSSHIRDGDSPGEGAIRECTDRRGRTWAERCIRYEPETCVQLEFLADEPGFPFPVIEMRGGWSLFPEDKGCVVEIWWEMKLKRFVPGVVIISLLGFQADRGMLQTVQMMADPEAGGDSEAKPRASVLPASIPC